LAVGHRRVVRLHEGAGSRGLRERRRLLRRRFRARRRREVSDRAGDERGGQEARRPEVAALVPARPVTTGVAAVFQGPGRPWELVESPLRPPGPGEVLVRVLLSSVCGSDVHAWTGRRSLPTPAILGHEIVGVIEALGPDAPRDLLDRPLAPGQRVTWTEYIACGHCVPCSELALPQKCEKGRKYGHESAEEPPHLLGGFAQYCYLLPGTGIALVPPELTDAEAAPVNCGIATMVAATEAAA